MAVVAGGGAVVVVAAAAVAAADSVDGDEELGLKGLYGEFGWSFHWLAYPLRSTEMKIVFVYSRRLRCCRTTGSGSDFWSNPWHTCR